MKNKISCNILFLLLICMVSCTVSAKSENFGKARTNAVSAFAELDGGGSGEEDLVAAVLKGTGTGEDEKSAKNDALSQLANSIVADIVSKTVISQEERDGKYTESLKNDILIRSNVFLKGVLFTKPVKKEGIVEVTAFKWSQQSESDR